MLEKLTSKNTALLVMDLQNDFCSEKGILAKDFNADVSSIHKMIPKLEKFIENLRNLNVKIIFTKQYEIPEGAPKTIKTLFERGKLTPKCVPNSWGSDFYKIKPLDTDIVLEKRSWDAFTNKQLFEILESNNIEFLIFTGVFTTICIESTARRAFSEGYEVIIPKDLVAVNKQREKHQELSLEFFDNFLAVVTKSEEILKDI